MNIKELEDKYLGKKVLVIQTDGVQFLKNAPADHSTWELSKEDTTIRILSSEALGRGLDTRLWLPTAMGTMDFRGERLNVHVTKQADGTYEITRLNIG